MSTETQQASSVTEFKKREDTVTDKERGKNLRLNVGGYGLRLQGVRIKRFSAKRITIYDPRAHNRPLGVEEFAALGGAEGPSFAEGLAAEAGVEDAAGAEDVESGGLSLEGVEMTGISVESASLQHPPEPDPQDVEG